MDEETINGNGSDFFKDALILITGFIAVILLFRSFEIVSTGGRGVVTRFGAVQDEILSEGISLKNPLNRAIEIDTQTLKIEVEATASSKDLQDVNTKIALNYHLDPLKVNKLYQEIGLDFDSRVIQPAIQEAIKASTAKYTAEELVTKREIVKDTSKNFLSERLSRSYIIVDDLSIVNFSFSESFNNAIENKVKAEQEALTAKNQLERIKFEAEQKIATARADAESIRLQSEALKQSKDLVQLKMVEKWDGKLPVNLYGNAPLPFLNVK